MKASIYYQDFSLNSCTFGDANKLRLDTVHSHFIGEVVIGIEDKMAFADKVFHILNTEPDLLFPQEVFKAIGHTSMSVGDYIYFEEKNGEKPFYMICASSGWHIIDLDFEERRHKVKKFIETLPIGTIEGIFRELEKGKDNEVLNILSDNFYKERIRCENCCPKCDADENFIKWGNLEIIEDSYARNATCQKCKTNFTEYYPYFETEIEEDDSN